MVVDEPVSEMLLAQVTERPTGTFQIGAGFSSVENFIAQAQISQNNLFGRGQNNASVRMPAAIEPSGRARPRAVAAIRDAGLRPAVGVDSVIAASGVRMTAFGTVSMTPTQSFPASMAGASAALPGCPA